MIDYLAMTVGSTRSEGQVVVTRTGPWAWRVLAGGATSEFDAAYAVGEYLSALLPEDEPAPDASGESEKTSWWWPFYDRGSVAQTDLVEIQRAIDLGYGRGDPGARVLLDRLLEALRSGADDRIVRAAAEALANVLPPRGAEAARRIASSVRPTTLERAAQALGFSEDAPKGGQFKKGGGREGKTAPDKPAAKKTITKDQADKVHAVAQKNAAKPGGKAEQGGEFVDFGDTESLIGGARSRALVHANLHGDAPLESERDRDLADAIADKAGVVRDRLVGAADKIKSALAKLNPNLFCEEGPMAGYSDQPRRFPDGSLAYADPMLAAAGMALVKSLTMIERGILARALIGTIGLAEIPKRVSIALEWIRARGNDVVEVVSEALQGLTFAEGDAPIRYVELDAIAARVRDAGSTALSAVVGWLAEQNSRWAFDRASVGSAVVGLSSLGGAGLVLAGVSPALAGAIAAAVALGEGAELLSILRAGRSTPSRASEPGAPTRYGAGSDLADLAEAVVDAGRWAVNAVSDVLMSHAPTAAVGGLAGAGGALGGMAMLAGLPAWVSTGILAAGGLGSAHVLLGMIREEEREAQAAEAATGDRKKRKRRSGKVSMSGFHEQVAQFADFPIDVIPAAPFFAIWRLQEWAQQKVWDLLSVHARDYVLDLADQLKRGAGDLAVAAAATANGEISRALATVLPGVDSRSARSGARGFSEHDPFFFSEPVEDGALKALEAAAGSDAAIIWPLIKRQVGVLLRQASGSVLSAGALLALGVPLPLAGLAAATLTTYANFIYTARKDAEKASVTYRAQGFAEQALRFDSITVADLQTIPIGASGGYGFVRDGVSIRRVGPDVFEVEINGELLGSFDAMSLARELMMRGYYRDSSSSGVVKFGEIVAKLIGPPFEPSLLLLGDITPAESNRATYEFDETVRRMIREEGRVDRLRLERAAIAILGSVAPMKRVTGFCEPCGFGEQALLFAEPNLAAAESEATAQGGADWWPTIRGVLLTTAGGGAVAAAAAATALVAVGVPVALALATSAVAFGQIAASIAKLVGFSENGACAISHYGANMPASVSGDSAEVARRLEQALSRAYIAARDLDGGAGYKVLDYIDRAIKTKSARQAHEIIGRAIDYLVNTRSNQGHPDWLPKIDATVLALTTARNAFVADLFDEQSFPQRFDAGFPARLAALARIPVHLADAALYALAGISDATGDAIAQIIEGKKSATAANQIVDALRAAYDNAIRAAGGREPTRAEFLANVTGANVTGILSAALRAIGVGYSEPDALWRDLRATTGGDVRVFAERAERAFRRGERSSMRSLLREAGLRAGSPDEQARVKNFAEQADRFFDAVEFPPSPGDVLAILSAAALSPATSAAQKRALRAAAKRLEAGAALTAENRAKVMALGLDARHIDDAAMMNLAALTDYAEVIGLSEVRERGPDRFWTAGDRVRISGPYGRWIDARLVSPTSTGWRVSSMGETYEVDLASIQGPPMAGPWEVTAEGGQRWTISRSQVQVAASVAEGQVKATIRSLGGGDGDPVQITPATGKPWGTTIGRLQFREWEGRVADENGKPIAFANGSWGSIGPDLKETADEYGEILADLATVGARWASAGASAAGGALSLVGRALLAIADRGASGLAALGMAPLNHLRDVVRVAARQSGRDIDLAKKIAEDRGLVSALGVLVPNVQTWSEPGGVVEQFESEGGYPTTKEEREKVSAKISKLMGEGYPQKQAVAIALSMWRRGKLREPGDVQRFGASYADQAARFAVA